ncbi:MAG: serine/threonine protein kinase [Planctomycetes bacterium]|nr:serine/threonine protein kinase [Planctomycetota bacterium]
MASESDARRSADGPERAAQPGAVPAGAATPSGGPQSLSGSPQGIEELARQIADGESIDWERWTARAELDRSALEALRTLQVMRDWQRGADAGGRPAVAGFEVREELGRGSYARVWSALDTTLGREVALKVVDEARPLSLAARERFLSEARVLASLDHPNIVRVHSVGEASGRLFLCLERVHGKTLADWVDQRGPLSATEAARVGVELCRALVALHAKGLVHRDLKPSNAMRAENGRVVLLDFGFARSTSSGPGSAGGTPRFMAPEQFDAGREGAREVGPKADLYALGVLLYWLVSKRHPHDAEDFESLRAAVLAQRTIPLGERVPDVPETYARIVARALAPEQERFATAGEMEQALGRFLEEPQRARPTLVEAPTSVADEPAPGVNVPWKGMLIMSAFVSLPAAAWWGYTTLQSNAEAASAAPDEGSTFSMKMIYLGCAIAGGAVLFITLVMSLLGGVHDLDVGHEVDVGAIHHGDIDSQAVGLSVRTVVAFITFFGLTGMALDSASVSSAWTFVGALVAGGLAFWLVGLAMLQLNKLRASGTVEIKNSVGAQARVYLAIPGHKSGTGAVTVPIQGRTMEYRAVTSGEALPTGSYCRVVAVQASDTVEVSAL